MKTWKAFTGIWKSVQGYIFIDMDAFFEKILSGVRGIPLAIGRFFYRRLGRPFAAGYRRLKQDSRASILFFTLALLPVLLVSIFTVLLPAIHLPLPQSAKQKAAAPPHDSTFIDFSALSPEQSEMLGKIYALETEAAFLNSRLQAARIDSISLSLNLRDSTLNIDIRGVAVRPCKIQEFSISKGFKHLQDRAALLGWLSALFVLEQERATIPKSQIIVKKAPKDTLEAQKMYREPIPPERKDVYVALKFDRGLILEIEQAEPPSWQGRFSKWLLDARQAYASAEETVRGLVNLQPPRHLLWIKVKISAEDARAIYRALPHQAQLSLNL